MTDFTTVLSVRAPEEHINIMEGKAFLAALRWVLRRPDRHRRRVVVLIDSRVWIGAAAKGRSSSVPLLRLLRRVAAMVLASGVVVHYVYVPSAHNPADAPSRGIRARRECGGTAGRPRLNRLHRELDEELWYLTESYRAMRHGPVQADRERAGVAARDLAEARTALARALRSRDALGSGRLETRVALRVLTMFVASPEARADAQALLRVLGIDDAVLCYTELLDAFDAFVAAPGIAADLDSSDSDLP